MSHTISYFLPPQYLILVIMVELKFASGYVHRDMVLVVDLTLK